MALKNQNGEVYFSMKRKGEKYGQCYYLFETHMDRIDPNELGRFQILWKLIKQSAKKFSIPLFDTNEIDEALNAYFAKHKREPNDQQLATVGKRKQVDVTLKIRNHADDSVRTLTVGIKTPRSRTGKLRPR
jgi:hypothetical protein